MSFIFRSRLIRKHRSFTIRVMRLALPMALQALLQIVVEISDNVMVGQLGETAIAGVALGAQVFFIFFLMNFGITSGGMSFLGQYWGENNHQGFRQILVITLLGAIICAAIFMFLSLFFSEGILRIYSSEPDVVSEGRGYLRIVLFCYPMVAISSVFFTSMRAMGETKIPFFISLAAFFVNIFLNWMFIFGNLGFPALGVEGAAWGTTISRALETLVTLVVVQSRSTILRNFWRGVKGWVKKTGKFFRVVSPVIANELGWALGISMYFVVLGRMGKEEVTAYTLTDICARVLFVIFFGTGQAAAIIVSNTIGENRFRRLKDYVSRLINLALIGGIVTSLLLSMSVFFLPGFFQITPETKQMMLEVILGLSLIFTVRLINFHIFVGILRAGADTVYALTLEMITLWGVGVPLAFLSGLVFHFPLVWVIVLSSGMDEGIKLIFGLHRIRSFRWVNQLSS